MTTFRDGFMMKSPLPAHGKLEKKLEKAKAGKIGAEQGDKDYELIADLESQIKEAKAKHRPMRRKDDTLAKEDEDAARGSAAEMSPFEQGGYVGGGMSKDDYAPVADLYQNMFNKISGAADKVARAYFGTDEEDKDKNKSNRDQDKEN